MQAIVFDGEFRVTDVPTPAPTDDEALIRVREAGICNTDLEIVRGYMDFRGVLGHEFVGEVVESRAAGSLVGRRVVGEINCGRGNCEMCRRGLRKHCTDRTVLGIAGRDGAFAEFVTLPVQNIHPIPDAVSDDVAVFVEPLAACYDIVERRLVPRGERVLLVGDGKMAALCGQALAETGARVTCAGCHPEKFERLRALGLATVTEEEIAESAWAVVVDVSGSLSGMDVAMRAVRPRGTIVMKTTVAREHSLNLAPLVIDEVTLVGSRCGPFPPAIGALALGSVRVESLVDGVFPLADAAEAFERAAAPGALKVLFKID